MNGLALSELYYAEILKPFLSREMPEITGRYAAGLVGEGSECFGLDDMISRDHDWGARVCLWLDHPDFVKYGAVLSAKLQTLDDQFMGYPVIRTPGRAGVFEIQDFFKKYLGKGDKLMTLGEWLSVPHEWLAVASNGKVFEDEPGLFSEIHLDLKQGYPEDVRLKKLAYHCIQAGQAGQYNFPRMQSRGDIVGASFALHEFMEHVMLIVYLLNNSYAPFYKWIFKGMQRLPVLGNEISIHMRNLLTFTDKMSEIEEICELLIMEFRRQRLSDEQDCYLVAQGEDIHRHISLQALRETDPFMKV